MKTVLITGTSTGIGRELAIQASAKGYQVIATMRDAGKADALRAVMPTVDIRRLDVLDAVSIADVVNGVVTDYGHLDAVINNAGAGHVGTAELESTEDIRRVMDVNFFGVVEMTRQTLPHLRAAKGRLITVTSVGGVVGQPFNEAYCAAKFAVEGYMESLAPVLARLGVAVSVVEPGAVATEFVANVQANRDIPALVGASGDYRPIIESYIARTTGAFAAAQSAQDCAAAVIEVLGTDQPRFRYQTSPTAAQFVAVKLADTDGSAVQTLTSTWL
jgi:NAD(P)-dependent dehydrogenase (short-subunit alcohol dehydrogenase family)